MSNYLIMIVRSSLSGSIDKWACELTRNNPDELYTRQLKGCKLYYIAKGAQKTSRNSSIFKGFTIDHRSKRVIFDGTDRSFIRLSDLINGLEGCYIAARWTKDRVFICNDLFCQLPMLRFLHQNIVAVSDSIFCLSELRKYLRLRCVPDREVVTARSWRNAIATQLLSERTLIAGIEFCPPGSHLEIALPALTARVVQQSARALFPDCDYAQSLRRGVVQMASVAHSLAATGATAFLSLSGGLDSRACLAAMWLSPLAREAIVVTTSRNRDDDLAVLDQIARQMGFALYYDRSNYRLDEHKTPAEVRQHALDVWLLSSAGLYDLVLDQVVYNRIAFRFGGHGAEVLKGNYNRRSVYTIARHAPRAIAPSVYAQLARGIGTLGVEKADKMGSEWHYLGYRNAIHSGRFTLSSLFGARLFLQRDLVRASYARDNPLGNNAKHAPSAVSDVLIMLNPELAAMPFDIPEKNLPASFIEERLAELGGPISASDLEPYKLHGTPSNTHHGPTQSLLDMASKKRLNVTDSLIGIEDKIGSETMRAVYDWAIEDAKGAANGESLLPNSIGKVMSFSLFS